MTSNLVRACLRLADHILDREFRLLTLAGFDVAAAAGGMTEPFHAWISVVVPGTEARYILRLDLERADESHVLTTTFTGPDGGLAMPMSMASVTEEVLPEVILALVRSGIRELERLVWEPEGSAAGVVGLVQEKQVGAEPMKERPGGHRTAGSRPGVGAVPLAEIADARVDVAAIVFTLSDGRVISAPTTWSRRLAAASQAERDAYRIGGNGLYVEWPAIDEHIGVWTMLGIPEDDALRAAGFTTRPGGSTPPA